MASRRAVFLDRDGVINRYHYNAEFGTVDSPATPEQFELMPGAAEAIAELNQRNLAVIVVSNQPGIAKGKFSSRILSAITLKMVKQLGDAGARLDDVLYCTHHPDAKLTEHRADCDCRKPKPGLLFRAAKEQGLDLAGSFLVGDGVDDIVAGNAAGVATILLGPRSCAVCEEFASRRAQPHRLAVDLKQATRTIGETLAGRRQSSIAERGIEPCTMANGERAYTTRYLREAAEIAATIDASQIERVVSLVRDVRERGGRIFLLGGGEGSGHASHAAIDFRRIAGIEAYCVSDNVPELTARVNDEGWDTCYLNWLRGRRLRSKDMVFIFSAGGGDLEKNNSANLIRPLQYARKVGCAVAGIVGPGDYTAQLADACVLVPLVNQESITTHAESFQAVVWHLLVSHPSLKTPEMKWESVARIIESVREIANKEEIISAAAP